ncbi:MAG: PAS domain S-box protein [Haloferacaceae archaeon]
MRRTLRWYLGVGFVGGSGAAFTALNVAHALRPEPVGGIVFGVVPSTVLSVALCLFAVRLAADDVRSREVWRLGRWTVLGVGVGVAVSFLFVTYERLHGGVLIDAEHVLLSTVTGGASIGALLGHYDVKWRRQARALDATNRILDTVRKVDQEVVAADSRAELETRACRALADAEPYDFAWIGGVDADGNEVVPRSSAGAERGYLDDISIRLDDETSDGPTGRAVRSREPQVLQDVHDGPGYEPWRTDALERGYQSSMAIPLVHGEDLYGVLNVYADRPDAFGEREQDVLAELGDTVAAGLDANAVRESQREVLDGMNDAVFVHSLDRDRTLAVNRTAVERLGYTAEELCRMAPGAVGASGSASDFAADLERVAAEGSLVFETVLETASGEPIPTEVNATRITFRGDAAVLAIARDISERKEKERKLRTFREAVEHAGHAIYITGVDGTIEYANTAFEDQTGYAESEALGRTPALLNSGAHDDEFYDDLWRTILDGEVWHREEMIDERRDGTRFYVDQTIAPITDEAGEIEHFVAVSRDVTELREYQRLLEERNDQLELLNHVVRHDIRNDMQMVLGMARTLEAHVEPGGEDYLEPLCEHGEHVVELTRTVRDLMEVMLSENEPGLRPVSLAQVLDRQIAEVDRGYERAVVEVVGGLPAVRIPANGMLESVFRNVLKNAVQHNDTETPNVAVTATARDGTVRVRIADDGPGVPDRLKETIFDESATGLESGGTGLGLYLVGTLVEQYGGDVWVEDNEPRGAAFVLEFPTVAAADDEPPVGEAN